MSVFIYDRSIDKLRGTALKKIAFSSDLEEES